MLHELCNPVTMKLMALGRPLHEAERLAAVIVVWVVLLYVMMGYSLSIEGIPQQVRDRWSRPCCGIPGGQHLHGHVWDSPGCCRDRGHSTPHSSATIAAGPGPGSGCS
jgi:hypothetical protein